MALIPSWFSASTRAIVEKALERGIFKYPGICFIQDTKSLAWVTQDNEIQYINGTNQITDIKFIGTNLMFYSNKELLYSFDMSMTEEDANHIIEEVKSSIGLDQYVKSSEVNKLLDDIVGNLEDKATVVDYINALSYNKLSDKPIVNLIGSLNVPVYISSLDDGVYKIKGQYIISQSKPSIQSSADDVLFFVSHDPELHEKMTITKMQGTSIVLYFLQTDGTYRTDKYITENWITEQNYMSAENAKEFVLETIQETVENIIDQQLDAKLDSALDKKISGISTEELTNIFN